MGKWADSEYDRLAVAKLQRLFDIATASTDIGGSPGPKTLRTFIKELDPNDKAVQACFTKLVKRHFYSHSFPSTRTRVPVSPSTDPAFGTYPLGDDWELFHEPARRAVDLAASDVTVIDHRASFWRDQAAQSDQDATPADPDSPGRLERRSASPSHSPSRQALIDGAPSPSRSPRSPSRAWLDEYQASQSAAIRPASSFRYLYPTRYRARGRDEEDHDEERERAVRVRHERDSPERRARRHRTNVVDLQRLMRTGSGRDTRRDGIVLDMPDDQPPWPTLNPEAEPFLPSQIIPNRSGLMAALMEDGTIDFVGNPAGMHEDSESDVFPPWRNS